jgi:hypothetical protein
MPVLNISTTVRALLTHLAESNDALAMVAKAVLDAEESEPGATGFATTATTDADSTPIPGTATLVSRGDHQHAHGTRGGGTLHPAATGSVNGFMASADKTKLDGVAASAAALTSSAPVAVTSAAAEVGDGTTAARNNHKHAIAQAGAGAEGLMSAAHYSKLDALPANISPALTPATYTTITSITVDAYGRITAIAGT